MKNQLSMKNHLSSLHKFCDTVNTNVYPLLSQAKDLETV